MATPDTTAVKPGDDGTMRNDGPGGPDSWESDVLLRDGATMHLRALSRSDREALYQLHERSSEKSHYRRYFTAMPHLRDDLLDRLSDVDQINRVALACENTGGICAVGRYDRTPGSSTAEVAFDIDDANQGRGIGTILLERLADIARERGIQRFEAYVLAENIEMIGLFRRSGFAVSTQFDDPGTRLVLIDLNSTDASIEARFAREAVAVRASVQRCFEPTSVAVIGATDTVGRIGHQLMANIVAGGYTGRVYPVNPEHATVMGLAAFARITDIGSPVDLAVVAVPAEQVETVVGECAQAHVGALVIVTAGFAELGSEGAALQDRVMRLARMSGMRVIGPNCLGIANTSPTSSFNATFASLDVPHGSVGVMTQSGAVGIEVIHELRQRGLGVSSFASVGNKADVSGNDLLAYWEDDDNTRQIALYLESFGNPRAFARIAPRVARKKPILAIKSGRTAAAATSATTHTAALALPDQAVDALLLQSGVIRVGGVDELVDVCAALESQPLPAGRRVAIVTNAGGPAILAADVCDAAGVQLAELSSDTVHDISQCLERSVAQGPLDLRADATPELTLGVLTMVANDPNVDAIVVIVADVAGVGTGRFAASIAGIPFAGPPKPVLCSFVPSTEKNLGNLPVFRSAERAIRTLGYLCERQRWLDEIEQSEHLDTGIAFDPEAVTPIRGLVDAALAGGPDGGWMPAVDAFRLMELAGIPVVMPTLVDSRDAAVSAASSLGYPVALKVATSPLLHRSEGGGVQPNLKNGEDVAGAYDLIEASFGRATGGCLVQHMAPRGVELLAGIVTHSELGPVVVVGEGGTLTELRRDTAVRRPPLSRPQAVRQLRSLRIAKLLSGYRDSNAVNEDAVVEVMLRLSRLAVLVPEIAELDINPLIATGEGVVAVDVKVKLSPAEPSASETLRPILREGAPARS